MKILRIDFLLQRCFRQPSLIHEWGEMKSSNFWVIKPCSSLKVDKRFGGKSSGSKNKLSRECRILGSHNDGNKEFYLLGYNIV
jgi:hypothetical protein